MAFRVFRFAIGLILAGVSAWLIYSGITGIIDSVGAGPLSYIVGEGMLHLFKSDAEWLRAAEEIAPHYDAQSRRHRGLPTDALIPLARGFRTLAIQGGDAVAPGDKTLDVDFAILARAQAFVEDLIRRLDESAAENEGE